MSLDEHPGDAGVEEGDPAAPYHGPQRDLRDVGLAVRCHRAEAPDLDADAREVREAAEGVGGDLERAVRDVATLVGRGKTEQHTVLPYYHSFVFLM